MILFIPSKSTFADVFKTQTKKKTLNFWCSSLAVKQYVSYLNEVPTFQKSSSASIIGVDVNWTRTNKLSCSVPRFSEEACEGSFYLNMTELLARGNYRMKEE